LDQIFIWRILNESNFGFLKFKTSKLVFEALDGLILESHKYTRHQWVSTKQIDRYGKSCNIDLGLQVVTDQESGNRPHPLANIRQARRPLYHHAIFKQSTPTTWRRVLLSWGTNQYKLDVFSVFYVLVHNLWVLSLRFHLTEQLNHRD
jgi:hypothetical protein